MTTLAALPPTPWRADATPVALISLGHAVSHFYQLALAPLFPWWRDAFALDWTRLGLIMTVFYIVSCIGQAVSGFAVDRFGARRALIGGFALMAAGALLAAGANGYPMLLAAAVIVAIGNSVFHPADYALLNHKISERRIGHAYSAHAISGTLGYAAAPVVMTALALAFGWRSALLFAAALGVAMALLVMLRAADFTPGRGTPDSGRGGAGRAAGSIAAAPIAAAAPTAAAPIASETAFFNSALAACMLFFVTVNIAGLGIQNMGASLLTALGRMDQAAAAGWITTYIVMVAVGMVIGGFLVSGVRSGAGGSGGRYAPAYERIAGGGTVIGAFALFALIHPAVSPLGTGLLLCVAGTALGVVTPARDLLVRAAAPRQATGQAYGIVYSAVDIGAAIGPAVMGWWLDHGRAAGGFVTAGVALLATAAAGWLIAAQVRRLGLDRR
ncbi:MAG: MFS transporter [Lautropia sp.]